MLNSMKSWSVTCGLRLNKVDRRAVCGASISAWLHRGPRVCFHGECHTDGKSIPAPRVNRSLAPINVEHEAGQHAGTIFQVFGLTDNESNPA